MKILQMRGENIASLAKPFEIRFDEGLLAGVGLFAITGNTGAGKSSILDTLCLGLYGDCPRLGHSGVNDDVPDVGGDPLSSKDTRTMLRHGAASGHAIVMFRAQDGEVYEAKWSVRRARGNAVGRLQPIDRSITRLSDGSIVESQNRLVDERIVQLTGLTYDEFRRSVLLAQGDFDSFLRAGTTERAAILEKVTGTGIYREISKRVFAEFGKAQRIADDLIVRLGEHKVLPDDELLELNDRVEELVQRLARSALATSDMRKGLERHKVIEGATELRDSAHYELLNAASALSEIQDLVKRVSKIHKATALRSEFQELTNASQAAKSSNDQLIILEDSKIRAEGVASRAASNFDSLTLEHEQYETNFQKMGPVWSQAEKLDGQIDVAITEELNAAEILGSRTESVNQQQAALLEKKQTIEYWSSVVAKLTQQLATDPHGDQLLAGWAILQDRLSGRMNAAKSRSEALKHKGRLEGELSDANASRESFETKIAAARESIAILEEAISASAPRLAELSQSSPAAKLVRVDLAIASLRIMGDLAAKFSQETALVKKLGEHLDSAKEAIETNAAEKVKAQREVENADLRISELEEPTERAEASVSIEAQKLRNRLDDGKPCPVCGSLSHPILEESRAADAAKLLRQRLNEARTARSNAIVTITRCDLFLAQAHDQVKDIAQQQRDCEINLREISGDFANHVGRENNPLLKSRISASVAGANQWLTELTGLVTAGRAKLEIDLKELEELDLLAKNKVNQINVLSAESRTLQTQCDQIDADLKARTDQIRESEIIVQLQDQVIATLDANLSQDFAFLESDWQEFDENGTSSLMKVTARKDRFAATKTEIESISQKKESAQRELEQIQSRYDFERLALVELDRNLQQRTGALQDLRRQRGVLLDGQPTGPHRTAFNLRRKAASDNKDEAAGVLSSARSSLAASVAATAAGRQTISEASARVERAQAALDAALLLVEIDRTEAAELFDTDASELGEMQATIKAAEDRKLRAEENFKTREIDLATAISSGLPERTKHELETDLMSLADSEDRIREEQAQYRATLTADTEAREQMSELTRQLVVAKATSDTLKGLNDVIGSSTGDKFTSLAQQVTLGILVEHANQHLKDVKPRYHLKVGESDLSLYIVDEHMAGEIRSTRSLSGGERFLVSLTLALALSTIGKSAAISDTLFIDEGFGTLDAESLEMAIDVLEALRAQGRTIGVISHIQAMQDRIPTQIRVKMQGAGASEISVFAG